MIIKLTDLNELSGVSSPLLPLIYCVGQFSFGNNCVYLQRDELNDTKAIFSVKNGEAVLLFSEDAAVDELKSFFGIYSVNSVISDKPLDLFCELFNEYPLMVCEIGSFTEDIPLGCQQLTEFSNVSSYKKVYDLISENSVNFDEWYTEFSKKINNHSAFCSFYESDDRVISGAIINSKLCNNAILSGVYTHKDFRHQGLAAKCVSDVIRYAKKSNVTNVTLWCENNVVDFYKKLDFKEVSKIYIGVFN